MSDLVLQGQEKLSKAAQKRQKRLSAMQVQNSDLTVNPSETVANLSNQEILQLVKSGLEKFGEDLTDNEISALALQTEVVRNYIESTKDLYAARLAKHNEIITGVNQTVDFCQDSLNEFVGSTNQHFQHLNQTYGSKSVQDVLKEITGCDSIEEYLNGGEEMPGELATSEN